MTPDSQKVFFVQVFGSASGVVKAVEVLNKTGVDFEVTLYALKASIKGAPLPPQTLTVSTSALMKNQASQIMTEQNHFLVKSWLANLWKVVPVQLGKQNTYLGSLPFHFHDPSEAVTVSVAPTTGFTTNDVKLFAVGLTSKGPNIIATIKAVRKFTNWQLKEAKDYVDNIDYSYPKALLINIDGGQISAIFEGLAQEGVTCVSVPMEIYKNTGFDTVALPVQAASQPKPAKNIPTGEVIPLRMAMAVGQKVKGTSPTSIYHTIAVNDRVKVAAKISKYGELAFRVECIHPTPMEMSKVKQAVDWKTAVKSGGAYGSKHMSAGDIPIARVVGAFLLGFGVQFDDQITYEGQLVMDNG